MHTPTIIIESTDAFSRTRRGIGMQMRAWLETAPFEQFAEVNFVLAASGKANELDILPSLAPNVQHYSTEDNHYIDSLYNQNPDLIFFPTAEKHLYRQHSAKVVGIDYGMEDFYCRNYIAPRELTDFFDDHAFAFEHFDSIITVSQTSKKDLAWFFPEHKDKIAVIYPSLVPRATVTAQQLPAELHDSRYFLIVGYEKKKNIIRIAQAFDEFKTATKSTTKLAIIGKPGYGAAEIGAYIDSLAHKADIIRLGYVSEEQKQQLVENCHALLALAIYEGFGISALEGLQARKLTLVSNNGSLKEVVGEAGFTADPFSVLAIKQQLTQLDVTVHNPKEEYAAERLAVFEPKVQAQKLLTHLVSVLNR